MNVAKTLWVVLSVAVLGAAAAWWIHERPISEWPDRDQLAVANPDSSGPFPVRIRPGPETPRVMAALTVGAEPALIACSTCHATRPPDRATVAAGQLTEFHQGLRYAHGELSCLSCHNPDNYDTLRKADGSRVEFPQTVELCAQCHGPQYRDYTNYSHGGLTGYWDLMAGPRQRNTCTNCHDPHHPAYPRIRPVFPPQDRGARQQRERSAHAGLEAPHG